MNSEDPKTIFPDIDSDTKFVLNYKQKRKSDIANHSLKIIQINLAVLGVFVAFPIFSGGQGMNNFELFIGNLYLIFGAVTWIISTGSILSAYIDSLTFTNPELNLLHQYAIKNYGESTFRELLRRLTVKSGVGFGHVFWKVALGVTLSIVSIILLALGVINTLLNGFLSFYYGLWLPFGILLLAGVIPAMVSLFSRRWPKSVGLLIPVNEIAQDLKNDDPIFSKDSEESGNEF